MPITFYLDKEKMSEDIELIFDIDDKVRDFTHYANELYRDRYDAKIIDGKVICKTLIKDKPFYTVCDILSINFSDLSTKLLDVYNLYSQNDVYCNEKMLCASILDILSKFHCMLADDYLASEVFRSVHHYMRNQYKFTKCNKDLFKYEIQNHNVEDCTPTFPISFDDFVYCQQYLNKIVSGKTVLNNSNVFKRFAVNTIGREIPNSTNVDIDVLRSYDVVDRFIEKLEYPTNEAFYEYSCENIFEFITANLYNIFDSGLTVKKCNNCGKFFVPYNRSDTIYCDRVSPQDVAKTCKEYGAIKSYHDNLKNNEAMGLYRKIYMAKQMLARRNPDVKEYAKNFEEYKLISKQWKREIKEGIKTEAEYLEWLKAVKEKKV